jgi:ADP-ribose pyrophosphatase YjhB (NUDIX family)
MTEPRSQQPLAANNPPEHVRAAGGVVVRVEANGRQEILLVHRPQYGDWTLPKGKARDGETDEDCALREVEEETGLRCTLVRELASSEYIDRKKRPKVVRYWEMAPAAASPLDTMRWTKWRGFRWRKRSQRLLIRVTSRSSLPSPRVPKGTSRVVRRWSSVQPDAPTSMMVFCGW